MRNMSLVFFALMMSCGLLFGPGCRSYDNTDDFKLPVLSKKMEYPRNWIPLEERSDNMKNWQKTIQLSEYTWVQGKSILDQATQSLYLLLDSQSLLIPVIDDPKIQRRLIAVSEKSSMFVERQLPREQIGKINDCWQKLLQADRYFLQSQVIIAELRGKWRWWVVFPYLPDIEYFPSIAKSLQSLPTVWEIECHRQQVVSLLNVCRQLLAQNTEILPPLELVDDFTD